MMRALWQPRLIEAVRWIVRELAARPERRVLAVEQEGAIDVAGVTLKGKFDRIDAMGDGTLGIVDYKTGQPPSTKAVRAGYSLQLGLLGLIAERGGFEGIAGRAELLRILVAGAQERRIRLCRDAGRSGGEIWPHRDRRFRRDRRGEFCRTAAEYLTGERAVHRQAASRICALLGL